MPRYREDPNYDTTTERKMDLEPPHRSKVYQQKKRCTCSTIATIKTVHNLGRGEDVIYHCSELCRGYWQRKHGSALLIISTERNTEGWPVEGK